MTYLLLEDLLDAHYLNPRPMQVWILLTMEITIRTEDGYFLIVKQPYYGDMAEGSRGFSGAWAPPFIGVPVPLRFDVPASPAELKARFAEIEESLAATAILEQYLYEMGVENPVIEEREPFTEVKSSPRSPGVTKAYKIRRFGVRSNLSTSKSNIADPDGRKGFVFLPIENLGRYVSRSHEDDGRPSWTYLGLPLMTNVASVLSRSAEIQKLKSSAIDVESNYFFHEDNGWIVVFDLSGYGRAVRYVSANLKSLDESGPEIADFFRFRLAKWFSEFLTSAGTRQVQHAGDGFLCAITGGDSSSLARIIREVEGLQRRIDGINQRLPGELRLGSRTAILKGAYRYGRVGGAMSAIPGFDGENVVTAARLEQALREILYQNKTQLPAEDAGFHHVVVQTGDLSGRDVFANDNWECIAEEIELQSKEYSGRGTIFRRVRSKEVS